MGGLFGKKAPPADYQFHPHSPRRLQMGPIDKGDVVVFGAVGSAQWFNPASPADRRLTTYDPLPPLVETDSLSRLQELKHEFIIYQHWWPETEEGYRPVGAMRADHAGPLAAALKGGPTRRLMLITGGFVPGAIRALGEQLEGHDLEYLGLFFYYSGDDITDDAGYPDEIADACRRLHVRRLVLLTSAFNEGVEAKLAEGLKGLEVCRVFEKDEAARYPQYKTPRLPG